ncbi:MAG: phosphate/phosphite/phosphonate ABC transporter substrate-binding protein [Verrucomicrobia bacterium]|nr:phosphate/phosphite/phosphonate ABC transporter substrate-binding protein [Verrucomicrobiota bacterium]
MKFSSTRAIACFCLFVVACSRQEKSSYAPEFSGAPPGEEKVLFLGVFPYYNPQKLHAAYSLLAEYLGREIPGYRVDLVTSRSVEDFEKRLYERFFDFAYCNGYLAMQSWKHGYRVFAKAGRDADYRGIILVRKDSGIGELADLKGKTISFADPTSLGGTMLPLYFLQTHGVDVSRDIRRLFVGSQESSIMSVYLGNSAAAATLPLRWKAFAEENPQIAAELVAKWETPPLVNNALVVRDDVPKEVVDKMASLLLGLQAQEEGRRILRAINVPEFENATDETYTPVVEFMKKYRSVVREKGYEENVMEMQ